MTVAVLFGGKSCEHNVSVVTGVQALARFPKEHKAVPVYIDERGVWYTGKQYADIAVYREKGSHGGKEVHVRPSSPYLYTKNGKKLCKIDCFLLCNHGVNGEDGSVQGLLQLSGIPYTGSKVAASAAGMRKDMMKRLFAAADLPMVPYVTVRADEYVNDSLAVIEKIKKELRFPMIVKPCQAGSSIGISVAHDYNQLFAAIRVALEWDIEAVVECALENFEEYNCAVLCGQPSEVEKPVGWKEFLTYEDKYLSKSDGVGRGTSRSHPRGGGGGLYGGRRRRRGACGFFVRRRQAVCERDKHHTRFVGRLFLRGRRRIRDPRADRPRHADACAKKAFEIRVPSV